jgi:prolyl oligopeptidase
MKADKQRSYDDFIAVAEDLVRRKISSPRHLGIEGGSNGGLLVGAVMLQRPELFNAVVCQVPLLDMRRYHRLLAGASWMAEFGDPDQPEDWAFISRYSPYHNVKAGVAPRSVHHQHRDDRVTGMRARWLQAAGPAHAAVLGEHRAATGAATSPRAHCSRSSSRSFGAARPRRQEA